MFRLYFPPSIPSYDVAVLVTGSFGTVVSVVSEILLASLSVVVTENKIKEITLLTTWPIE